VEDLRHVTPERVERKNSNMTPHNAVALYANTSRRVNSFESLSYRESLPTMPINSVITANIGTPSTNAANIRWICAVIHTAPRPPTLGKSPYWRAASAAPWSRLSASIITGEERETF
jgi:hypothetical protein